MENRIMFGLEKENESWRVFSMISINGGTWSAPRRISKPYNTKEEAVADMGNYFAKLGIRNWIVYFETFI